MLGPYSRHSKVSWCHDLPGSSSQALSELQGVVLGPCHGGQRVDPFSKNLSIFPLPGYFTLFINVHPCACVCGYACVIAYVWRAEGGFRSFCSSCGLWGLNSGVRLGDKCLRPLSHLLVPSSRDSS